MTYCNIKLVGRLGADPELRYLGKSGEAICSFNLAVNRRWTDHKTGDRMEHTDWFRISVVGASAKDTSELLGKGLLVFVEGRQIKHNPYRRKDGSIATQIDIKADRVVVLDVNQGGFDSGWVSPDEVWG